jgi:type IV secretory pathway VirB2 component (pilin)
MRVNKKIAFLILFIAVLFLPAISLAVASGQTSLGTVVTNISDSLTGLATALATIGFIVSGIIYISATTNPSHMAMAKTALIAAVIGTIIALLASHACDFVNAFIGGVGACSFFYHTSMVALSHMKSII